jgi:hypothetical protein
MKRTRIFAAASTIILVVAGIFASKAAKKFTLVSTFYYKNSSSIITAIKGATFDALVTASTTPNKAFFEAGSTSYQLCTHGGTQLNAF